MDKQLPVNPLFWGSRDCSPKASWVRQREEEGIPALIFTVNTPTEPGEISQGKAGLSWSGLKPVHVTSSLGSDCSVRGGPAEDEAQETPEDLILPKDDSSPSFIVPAGCCPH